MPLVRGRSFGVRLRRLGTPALCHRSKWSEAGNKRTEVELHMYPNPYITRNVDNKRTRLTNDYLQIVRWCDNHQWMFTGALGRTLLLNGCLLQTKRRQGWGRGPCWSTVLPSLESQLNKLLLHFDMPEVALCGWARWGNAQIRRRSV